MTKVYSGVATCVDAEDYGQVYYYPDDQLHDSYDNAMKQLFRTKIPELMEENDMDWELPDSYKDKVRALIEMNKDQDDQDSDYDEENDDRYCWKFYFSNFDVDEVEFEDLFEADCDGFRVSYLITEYDIPKRPREDDEEPESNKRQK